MHYCLYLYSGTVSYNISRKPIYNSLAAKTIMEIVKSFLQKRHQSLIYDTEMLLFFCWNANMHRFYAIKSIVLTFIVGAVFCICFTPNASAKTDVLFTPSLSCEYTIEKLIKGSKESLDIVVYAINNDRLVDAIKDAHKRGVKVRVLTDRLQAAVRGSKVVELHDFGVNIKVHSVNRIEHNKFAVYDKTRASTGSYNWTNPASKKNSENCLFITNNKSTVQKYQNRFDYLWRINKKSKSDIWFIRRSVKNSKK